MTQKRKKPIFCLLGPSGAGKTSLIDRMFTLHPGMLDPIRTVTTRAPRPSDELRADGQGKHYQFVDLGQFVGLHDAGRLIQNGTMVYPDDHGVEQWYDNDRVEIDEVLTERFGICAWVEPTVKIFRDAGYLVATIRVTPEGSMYKHRSPARIEVDKAREAIMPWANHFLVNTFEPAEFITSAKRLSNILEPYLYDAKHLERYFAYHDQPLNPAK